jgi:methylglyoxal synthase
MFNPEIIIDTIQNGKKQFVNTFVQHDGVKKALNEFVDAQAAYTKSAVKTATEVNAKLITEMTKFDASKFFKIK